ncbi:MAG: hypothetical protein EAZ99_06050 [Alphaproteobacteria bacterium]|nr:MAG: hypothetical protein EAZ99_06050 [Alphaproteobacteria bacterium]
MRAVVWLAALMVAAGQLFVTAPARAEDLPQLHLKVAGGLGGVRQYNNFEEPFWTRTLRDQSAGRITAEIAPFDSMGLRSGEVMNLLRLGVLSFGSTPLAPLAADDAESVALDLPGLNPDIETLRRHVFSYRDTLVRVYRERYNVEILSIYTYPAQVLFCNGPLRSLMDLAGKRVRVSGVVQADMVMRLNATPINAPFNQIVETMRRRAIDCAITGTLSGNAIRLHEVATTLFTLPINWGINILAVNREYWRSLPPSVRSFLTDQLAVLEREIWANAQYETQQGIACNGGSVECVLGQRAAMTVVSPPESDRQLLQRILHDTILPRWAERCGEDCVATWNASVGRAAGLAAPTP